MHQTHTPPCTHTYTGTFTPQHTHFFFFFLTKRMTFPSTTESTGDYIMLTSGQSGQGAQVAVRSVVSHKRQKCSGPTSVTTAQWQNLICYGHLQQMQKQNKQTKNPFLPLSLPSFPFSLCVCLSIFHIHTSLYASKKQSLQPHSAGNLGTLGHWGDEHKPSHFALSV